MGCLQKFRGPLAALCCRHIFDLAEPPSQPLESYSYVPSTAIELREAANADGSVQKNGFK